MTDLERLAMELKQRTEWQDVPVQLTEVDYQEIVRQAIRHLYVMTGRSEQYDGETAIILNADEYEYALTTAELAFYHKVRADVEPHRRLFHRCDEHHQRGQTLREHQPDHCRAVEPSAHSLL